MNMKYFYLFSFFSKAVTSIQKFIEESDDITVNTGDDVLLPCLVRNKAGECRWEKDGTPVGMYEDKYEWAGDVEKGDCTIRVLEASEEYDTGVWQCQVTASDFTQKDTLISKGGFLSIRTQPESVKMIGNNECLPSKTMFSVKAGELINLKCKAHGCNPTSRLIWSINNVNTTRLKEFTANKSEVVPQARLPCLQLFSCLVKGKI